MSKKFKFKFSFRTVIAILTFILVAFVLYQNWPDIVEAWHHLGDTNIWIILLLIPEQLFMYYALGQIFFSYLKNRRDVKKLSFKERFRISTELNFINHAVPGGGLGGLTFLTYRFRPLGISAGQSSFMYLFRYAITTVINYLQALIAIIVLASANLIPADATWVLWVSLILNVGYFFAIAFVVFIASSKKRLDFFSRLATKIINKIMCFLTFGRRKRFLNYDKIGHYLMDIHESVLIAKRDKSILKGPICWGLIFSLFEVGTYYIVALSLGRPELLPYIMVGEAIGSVFDGITPYGLYEIGMAGVMVVLGIDLPTATIIVVMTRVAVLLFTIVTGAIPYNKTLRTLGKDENVSA